MSIVFVSLCNSAVLYKSCSVRSENVCLKECYIDLKLEDLDFSDYLIRVLQQELQERESRSKVTRDGRISSEKVDGRIQTVVKQSSRW